MRRRTVLGCAGTVIAGLIGGSGTSGSNGTGDGLGDERFSNGHRRDVTDRYELSFEWDDHASRRWTIDYEVYKGAFEAAVGRSRGYLQSFDRAQSSDQAAALGGRILRSAIPADWTSDTVWSVRDSPESLPQGDRLELIARFVQSFEHALDYETKGIHDYHRTIEETLVEGVGDCKDTTYLLAGLLSQPPFEYRTAMVVLPGHMLLGVHHEDLPADHDYAFPPSDATLPDGTYVPIETTAPKPIGYVRDDPVLVIYDGTVRYLDGSESIRTVEESLPAI